MAIEGDRITALGTVDESARRESDATRRLMTLGFIDVNATGCAAVVKEAERPTDRSDPLAQRTRQAPPAAACPAEYDASADNCLAAEAARRGTTPAAAFLDYLVETCGLGLVYCPVLNHDLDAVAQ